MMAVQNLIVPAPQLDSQSTNELRLCRKRHWRTDHARAKRSRLLFYFPWLAKCAVEGPIDINVPPPGMSQHTHEPGFYRSTIEIFDYVKHPFRPGTCQAGRSIQLAHFSGQYAIMSLFAAHPRSTCNNLG